MFGDFVVFGEIVVVNKDLVCVVVEKFEVFVCILFDDVVGFLGGSVIYE